MASAQLRQCPCRSTLRDRRCRLRVLEPRWFQFRLPGASRGPDNTIIPLLLSTLTASTGLDLNSEFSQLVPT